MKRSIKVAISGREYSLVGDNEELITATADEVNNHINLIVSNHGDLPDKTVNILAALNLAEEKLKIIEKSINDKAKLINELNNMADSLRNAINK